MNAFVDPNRDLSDLLIIFAVLFCVIATVTALPSPEGVRSKWSYTFGWLGVAAGFLGLLFR